MAKPGRPGLANAYAPNQRRHLELAVGVLEGHQAVLGLESSLNHLRAANSAQLDDELLVLRDNCRVQKVLVHIAALGLLQVGKDELLDYRLEDLGANAI